MTRPGLAIPLGFSLVLALAACDTGAPYQQRADEGFLVGSDSDPCGAGRWQDLVGQNSSVLVASDLPEETRILYPDMTATGQFEGGRMNVTVDGSNTITRVYCG
jgi:hypothetical protein